MPAATEDQLVAQVGVRRDGEPPQDRPQIRANPKDGGHHLIAGSLDRFPFAPNCPSRAVDASFGSWNHTAPDMHICRSRAVW